MLCINKAKNQNSTTAAVNLTTFMKEWKDFWYILNDFSMLSQKTKQIEKNSINFNQKLESQC